MTWGRIIDDFAYWFVGLRWVLLANCQKNNHQSIGRDRFKNAETTLSINKQGERFPTFLSIYFDDVEFLVSFVHSCHHHISLPCHIDGYYSMSNWDVRTALSFWKADSSQSTFFWIRNFYGEAVNSKYVLEVPTKHVLYNRWCKHCAHKWGRSSIKTVVMLRRRSLKEGNPEW